MKKIYAILVCLICIALQANAQRTKFYNLTADEVRIDSVLPSVAHNYLLPENFSDSTYEVLLKYPDFIDMSQQDIEKYKSLTTEEPGEMPVISYYNICSQGQSQLLANFCPIVKRNNKYQYLVSYMVEVKSKAVAKVKGLRKASSTTTSSDRYAKHSVLKSGTWAKIRVSESGIHQLTQSVIESAGFTDLSKVKIYGYGGNILPEALTSTYISEHDDLEEVPTCTVNGKRLFYANGPVYWNDKTTKTRVRNPYSDYGYYFITEGTTTPKTISEEDLLSEATASFDNYHTLHEIDDYAWFEGGRNLVEKTPIELGYSKSYTISVPEGNTTASFTVSTSAAVKSTVQVLVNDSLVGSESISITDYDKCNFSTRTFTAKNVKSNNTVTIKTTSGGPTRLDYIYTTFSTPKATPVLATDEFPTPEYVYRITNQDHHADSAYDMVIIIPTSQKILKQAQTLKEFHEQHDTLKVNIVPADELYNEFSSGTPDVSAYKRYLKMIYDRSPKENGKPIYPKYALLFGDCLWDNRMNTSTASSYSVDDYLLGYESENSFNEVNCFVSDDFIGMLDDGESLSSGNSYTGVPDVGIGRIPATTATAATGIVNKILNYANGTNSGAWLNTLMFLGDDGNNNIHMEDVNKVANSIIDNKPGYYVRKVMWDAYTEVKSSTGNTYPEVTSIIKQQQEDGALIIDFAGHGSNTLLSHEKVLALKDFSDFRGTNYPLWVTASCNIMPFDMADDNIGEYALLNSKGGAIAFYGTTRTVYSNYNYFINNAFINYITELDDKGRPRTFGEANRLTKEWLVSAGKDLTVNKLQYSLLADPALKINLTTMTAVIDSINGVSASSNDTTTLHAGSVVKIVGHITNNGVNVDNFNGLATAIVRDTEEQIVCKMNDQSSDGTNKAMTFTDRTKILYQGTDSVSNGKFSFVCAIPKDINYADGTGLVTVYAINNTKQISAHGEFCKFYVNGSVTSENDSIGPSIFCYLNSPEFSNGDVVNATPFFVAEIEDKDGINAAGAGIGHDLQLVIDGSSSMTYSLNKNFQFDFGSYTVGQTYYSIPELESGKHTLRFRAWDNQNNPSTAILNFEVQGSQTPELSTLYATPNPASDSVTFVIGHNRPKSEVSVKVEVMDASGRLLYSNTIDDTTTTENVYRTTWNLTLDNGYKIQTGVYLYRVSLSSGTSSWTSKAKKLIVVR